MIFTPSILRILSDEEDTENLDRIFSAWTKTSSIMLVGPVRIRNRINPEIKAAFKDSNPQPSIETLQVFNANTLAVYGREDLEGTEPNAEENKLFVGLIVIFVQEGAAAMEQAKREILKLDVEYLQRKRIHIVNWMMKNVTDREVTPAKHALDLESRFDVIVHGVYGDVQSSVEKLALKLSNILKMNTMHPEVPLF